MIRALFALLLLCGLAAGCGKQDAAAPEPSPALWAIESPAGETLGWLFGTIHALPDGARWETPALTGAIDGARMLVVEVRDLDPRRTAAIFDRLARDEPGPPLAERLDSTRRRDLGELLAGKGLPANSLDALETWAAALAVSRLGGTAPTANGVDRAVIARFAGRSTAELEGAAQQFAIFDGLPERDQRKLLAAVLAEQDDPAADARALADAWLAGDLARLERATRRGLLAHPALYKALVADRNAAWMQALVPLLRSGRRPLVAVGAAHMLGADGLPALLAAAGYRVRRLQ